MTLIGDHFLGEAQIESLRRKVTFGMVQLWEIRPDGVDPIRLAATDYPVDFGGSTFLPIGVSSQDMTKGEAAYESDMKTNGVLTHDSIREVDILSGRYNGAKIIHWIVDMYRPWIWYRKHVWWIKTISVGNSGFEAEIAGVERFMTIPIGANYEKECNLVFGGTRCGATVLQFGPSAVTAVPSTSGGTLGISSRDTRSFKIAQPGGGYPTTGGSHPPVWANGRVTFNSGNNNGKSMRIAHAEFAGGFVAGVEQQTGDMTVTLSIPAPFPIRVGDTVTIQNGCDGSLRTCRDIYENSINFGGQPEMPDTKDIYKAPEQDRDFEAI